MFRSKRFWVAVLVLLAAAALAFWLLAAADVVCVARTKVVPDPRITENDAVFAEAVRDARTLAFSSLVRSLDPVTSYFTYEEHPNGTISNADNDIRQLLASRVLAEAAAFDSSYETLHERNLSVIMENWYKEDGEQAYVYAYGKSKLGANAMLLRVLVASPDFARYATEAKRLAAGILSLMHEDGSFEPWYKEPDYAYDRDYLLTFYSGEATLALLEYGEKVKDVAVLTDARRAEDHYIGAYVDDMSAHYYPAYVPWHTLALSHLFNATKDMRYANAIFALNDKLLELEDMEEFIGRFYDPETPEYGSPHASSDAVYTEGLATAYAVAKATGDAAHARAYRGTLTLAFQNLVNLQYEAPWYRIFDDHTARRKLLGGIMTNACEAQVRIDSTAHAVDAFDAILRAVS
ncbi:MAG TPA: hypothetical protein VFS75_00745 [Candidatus Paceibacterota bacterium]|nr:hypothetical protein [Candidatus Paceibacterota bacterium]